jgi:hypothetical protein
MVKLAVALGTTPEALCAGINWDPKARDYKIDAPS